MVKTLVCSFSTAAALSDGLAFVAGWHGSFGPQGKTGVSEFWAALSHVSGCGSLIKTGVSATDWCDELNELLSVVMVAPIASDELEKNYGELACDFLGVCSVIGVALVASVTDEL